MPSCAYRATLICACLLAAFCALPTAAQTPTNQWTWISGSSTLPTAGYIPAVYGTLGTPDSANTPGSRMQAASWADSNGRLWLFGGFNFDNQLRLYYFNDLWQFDPSTSQWTWMGGSNNPTANCPVIEQNTTCGMPGIYGTQGAGAAANWPGGRYSTASWVDNDGRFWMFGGWGLDSKGQISALNDLWMFDPGSGQWTWMGGDTTVPVSGEDDPATYGTLGLPAARTEPGSLTFTAKATDPDGNTWLFGGWGYNDYGQDGLPNKLWEYVQSTGEWGWMAGPLSNAIYYDSAVYGTEGVAGEGNTPSSRWDVYGWADQSGKLWFFGGDGYDNSGDSGFFNQLWKFDPSLGEWTWIGGPQLLTCSVGTNQNCGNAGFYGTLGAPAPGNLPGSHSRGSSWTAKDGNLWLFGGVGFDANGYYNALNDLWMFNPETREWAWMGGPSASHGGPAVYGTLGVSSVANLPGRRDGQTSWTDKDGNFWLYGGNGLDANNYIGILDDLWRYVPSTTLIAGSFSLSANPAALSLPAGSGGNSTLTSAVQNGFNSAIALSAAGQPAGVTVSFQPSSITGAGDSTITIVPAVTAAPGVYPITVTGTSGSLKASTQVTLTITAPVPAAAPTFSPPAGTYAAAQSVSLSDATPGATIYFAVNGATPTMASTVYTGPIVVDATETIQAIATAPGYTTSPVASATYTIPPNFSFTLSPTAITVAAGQSGTSKITQTDIGGFADLVTYSCSGLPAGAACTITLQTVPNPVNTSFLTLTISTAAPASTSATGTRPPIFPGASLAVLLCGLCFRKRRRLQAYLLLVIAAVGLSALSGCIIVYTPHSHTNKYNVTVTGTSGALQHSETLGLTVN